MTSVFKPKSNVHGVVSDPEFSKMKSIAGSCLDSGYAMVL